MSPTSQDRPRAEVDEALRALPRFSIVMPVHDPSPVDFERALASYDAQVWPFRELCLCDDGSRSPEILARLDAVSERADVKRVRHEEGRGIIGATNAALALATGDFVVFLDHDDALSEDALFHVVRLLERHPDADFVFSDHDIVDELDRRIEVQHKPGVSPELLLAYMYVGHVRVVRRSLAEALGGFREGFEGSADYDFALRAFEATARIHHIPRVLYHWRAARGSIARRSDAKTYAFEAGRKAVEEAAARRGLEADVEWADWAERARLGIYRPRFRDTARHSVSIVIPTRDRLDMLEPCIASIENRTAHSDYEIVIVDNDSRDASTLDYLEKTPHRVVPSPGPFNFSQLVNAGARAARGEMLLLLNNDTLVMTPDWLDELIGWARLPEVGAVGAKLFYGGGEIQHAGVVLGLHGLAGHAFAGELDRHAPLETGALAHVARDCSAVTAACLMTRRALFLEHGGFDEQHFAVGWNDTDYCLRLATAGYRTVVNPYAQLIHLESQSRGEAKNDTEVAEMFERWRPVIERDPYYNPNWTKLESSFRPRLRLNERPMMAYGPDGFRRTAAAAQDEIGSDLFEVDMQSLAASQEVALIHLEQRVHALEKAEAMAQRIARMPLVGRLRRSPRIRRAYHRLRAWRHSPLGARVLRRLGLIP